MSKKAKVLIGVLVAVLVMTFGGAAVALADEEEEVQPAECSGFWGQGLLLPRVAEILEIPEDELLNAFNQAREEMGEEIQNRFMERECLQNRPGALDTVKPRARIFKAFRGRHMMASPGGWQRQAPSQPEE